VSQQQLAIHHLGVFQRSLSDAKYGTLAATASLTAAVAANSGAKGDKPAAIRSALMKTVQCASWGKNSRAKGVLPAPLGPEMMTIFFWKAWR
jgi:hypothetical protein